MAHPHPVVTQAQLFIILLIDAMHGQGGSELKMVLRRGILL